MAVKESTSRCVDGSTHLAAGCGLSNFTLNMSHNPLIVRELFKSESICSNLPLMIYGLQKTFTKEVSHISRIHPIITKIAHFFLWSMFPVFYLVPLFLLQYTVLNSPVIGSLVIHSAFWCKYISIRGTGRDSVRSRRGVVLLSLTISNFRRRWMCADC